MKNNCKTRNKKKKTMSRWDWTVLVAAWRYFEHRSTIAATSFPYDIIEKYFRGEYEDEVCERIARQFVEIDHRNCDASEWAKGSGSNTWFKFYCFLKAYHTNSWKKIHGVDCFFCEDTKRYYPKDKYIANPYVECYVDERYINEDKKKKENLK